MLKIGLTGGIGSGKTTVAKIFELLNVPVYYADDATKHLYYTDAALIASVKKHFGEDIYTGTELNRSKLAAIVFSDPEKLTLLNKLAHPPTIKNAEDWISKQTAPYIIKEAALLFESGSNKGLDYIICVRSSLELRIKRTMERNGIAKDDVINRMQRQMDEESKMDQCNFIIENNEQELVIPQVLSLHEKFIKMASEKS
ncbi:MAG: dephospho-CoA kinase [Bacteroidota bacterium]|nr:dephospho-CoA kinase [Bacteroidota bacterium]